MQEADKRQAIQSIVNIFANLTEGCISEGGAFQLASDVVDRAIAYAEWAKK